MPRFTQKDEIHMRRALELARCCAGRTRPNPAVGAVVTKNGTVVGEGYTAPVGGPHAEVRALEAAGGAARGATVYVTLEPCSHYGRTPPCTRALIAAGVSRVVYACADPNPQVNGRGARQLGQAGITTRRGLCSKEAQLINEAFFWNMRTGLPWVSCKLAQTLDGCIADTAGGSKWISSAAARRRVHEIRREHAAIAIGRQTLLADNPSLSVRGMRGPSPVRFIFTSTPDLDTTLAVFDPSLPQQTIAVLPGGKRGVDNRGHYSCWYTGVTSPKAHLQRFLHMLYEHGYSSVLIEGGQVLASGFIKHALVNRLYLFYGGKILGGGRRGIHFDTPHPLAKAIQLTQVHSEQFDNTVLITGLQTTVAPTN
jgi:diaminohydroxyphosphoribosylaminopyrimidine deaminase/5-amino-6-(5-phosphoribosylamino)uracil reductase